MTYQISIVGGCGHVGLPLGIALARNGFPTHLVDISEEKVRLVNSGVMPFLEAGSEAALKDALGSKRLIATTDDGIVSQSDVVIVIIGTPVDEYLNPRIHEVMAVIEQLAPRLNDRQVLVLRSTLFPGTTERVRDYLHEQGIRASVTFAPERIAQGKALEELEHLPQIISSFDERGLAVLTEIFGALAKGRVVQLRPVEAELAKLFSNAYRYINFAISNQFYQIAERAGADFNAIHHAVTHEYPRMSSFAKAGFAAGPCLFKDTIQLAAFSQNTFFLGHAAMLINEGMPGVTIDVLERRLGHSMTGQRVGILGMTFKRDNDDVRDSLAFKLRKLLIARGARVRCHDPYLQPEHFPHLFLGPLDEVAASPAVIIGAPHSVYDHLTFQPGQVVVDIWGRR